MLVSFPAGERALNGHLHLPAGDGACPAVLWNHGSERQPGSQGELGGFYASAGYALFVPHRGGHGSSPGEHVEDAIGPQLVRMPRTRAIEALIRFHERQLQDTLAALRWLRSQPFVDAGRVALSGVSHGGIQTLLAAEAGARAGAYVPFAPGATGWDGNPELQARLLLAVKQTRSPIFLLQAANDYSLGPSEALGEALRVKGAPNRARVYPAYGETSGAGHAAFACLGVDVWGPDVLAFLAEALTGASAPRRRTGSSARASRLASR
jgi:dienelactone hydrolase